MEKKQETERVGAKRTTGSQFVNSTVISTSQRSQTVTEWYDPLAQTIMIQSSGGAFLTGVDVYFYTKDANIPVNLQIRETVNGYPGPGILPFSKVSLTPDKVNTSSDASVPTRFTFESPVFVNDQVEYCVVLLSDSNNYRVWIAQLGEKNINSDRFISEQPYAGVLFKSQNGSTWTANQDQDLKFTIYRAQFDTTVVADVEFIPVIILDTIVAALRLVQTSPQTSQSPAVKDNVCT